MKSKKKFPFIYLTDEEIKEYISYAKKELHKRVNERDFEGFEYLGSTLIALELERAIRVNGIH